MRYGAVITPDQIGAAIAAGFDYVELPARELQPEGKHETALRFVSNALLKSGRPVAVEVFWGLLPPDMPLVGPDVDERRLRRYLHRAFTDMWALGGLLVVLASGASRRIPPGFPRERAVEQFVRALALIRQESDRNGLELALEPLNHYETNLLNTLDESRRFLSEYKLSHMRLLADFYHLSVEGEPIEAIEASGSLITHVHLSDTNRAPPGQGQADFGSFFGALRRIGYNGRLSIRCEWRDFAREAAPALTFVKRQWEQS